MTTVEKLRQLEVRHNSEGDSYQAEVCHNAAKELKAAEDTLKSIRTLFTYDTCWNGMAIGMGPDLMGFEIRLKALLEQGDKS